MSAAAIRDAVAKKIAALPSSQAVYANGSTEPTVAEWPAELADGILHALVGRGPSGRTGGTGNQWVQRGVDVDWRFPAIEPAEAERLMDALEDEILTEFSSGITLGGLAAECVYVGSERPIEVIDDNERHWMSWITHFAARERFAIEMTP